MFDNNHNNMQQQLQNNPMVLPNYSMSERDMVKTPQIRTGGAPNLNININGNAKLQNNININIINHNI